MDEHEILDALDRELGPATTQHHVLRRHGNTLLDVPITSAAGSRVWAATLSVDSAGHWHRSMWRQRYRGLDPVTVHYGDVIEFGTGTGTSATVWYGHLTDVTPDGVVVTGPYRDALEAHRCAQEIHRRWQTIQLATYTTAVSFHD